MHDTRPVPMRDIDQQTRVSLWRGWKWKVGPKNGGRWEVDRKIGTRLA